MSACFKKSKKKFACCALSANDAPHLLHRLVCYPLLSLNMPYAQWSQCILLYMSSVECSVVVCSMIVVLYCTVDCWLLTEGDTDPSAGDKLAGNGFHHGGIRYAWGIWGTKLQFVSSARSPFKRWEHSSFCSWFVICWLSQVCFILRTYIMLFVSIVASCIYLVACWCHNEFDGIL